MAKAHKLTELGVTLRCNLKTVQMLAWQYESPHTNAVVPELKPLSCELVRS